MLESHGAIGAAALRAGRRSEASNVPPPPIEWPDAASRVASILVRTELLPVRKSSADRIWVAREVGLSNVEFVLMVKTTKPKDDRRGPSQAVAFWVSVKPGA